MAKGYDGKKGSGKLPTGAVKNVQGGKPLGTDRKGGSTANAKKCKTNNMKR